MRGDTDNDYLFSDKVYFINRTMWAVWTRPMRDRLPV